jgi:AcrR family transcriptional regulator
MARKKLIFDRQKIIDSSFNIILNEGIDAFTARRLALELKISSMTVYNYYKNIDEIKKEVVIRGFSILYKMFFNAMQEQEKSSTKDDIKRLCRIFATSMINFAREYKEIYVLMFTEHGSKFRKDHETRLFYNFLPQLADRIRLGQDERADLKKKFYLYEIIIQGLIMEKIRKANDFPRHQLDEYVDFSLDCLF